MTTHTYDLAVLRKLSVAERLRLVGDLWDSLSDEAPDAALPLTPELKVEIDRRLASHARDASKTKSLDDVIASISQGAPPKER